MLSIAVIANISVCAAADTTDAIDSTAKYIYETVTEPQLAAVGGEWTILGLARSGAEVPEEYYNAYYDRICEYVISHNGILSDRKNTEYSRVILALTAIGRNPADVGGYNLLEPLADYDKTTAQGLNGAVWALIALDCGHYEIPQNDSAKTQATREMYIAKISDSRLADGGWALSGSTADADTTAMALQALTKYKDNTDVAQAIEQGISCLSRQQNADGGFFGSGTDNAESCAQVIAALCGLGISIDDPRFVKNGKNPLDNLMTYYVEGGGFKHTYSDTAPDLMTSEQCLYGLTALQRFNGGKNGLYDMDDTAALPQKSENIGLSGKNPDVKMAKITAPGRTFADISTHQSRRAIELLAERNIINGKSEDAFEPDSSMTRAEFAAIIVRGLGLNINSTAAFNDVKASDWFFDYVNTACSYGIVSGVSETEFNPNGTITREEAAVMTARAAKLCGMNTDISTFAARDILAGFSDYVKASDWAMTSLAFCCDKGILSDEDIEIKPKENICRAEIAQMLFNLLRVSRLI